MEDQELSQEPEKEEYTPGPASEVWKARIGLVLFLGLVIYQIISIARGFQ